MQTAEPIEKTRDKELQKARPSRGLVALVAVLALLVVALAAWIVYDAVRDDSPDYILYGADELTAVQQERLDILAEDGPFLEAWNTNRAALPSYFASNGYHLDGFGMRHEAADLEAFANSLEIYGPDFWISSAGPVVVWGDYMLISSTFTSGEAGSVLNPNHVSLIRFVPASTLIMYQDANVAP